jgi:hypothetical protein
LPGYASWKCLYMLDSNFSTFSTDFRIFDDTGSGADEVFRVHSISCR